MRLAELEARIGSISGLDEVVSAMRALAAVRLRQAQESLNAARVYAETMRAALDAARSLLPQPEITGPESPLTIVVFGTEHGFAGAYNERLLDQAAGCAPIVVGSRAVSLARERGLDVIAGLPAASHPSGVLDVALAAAAHLARYLEQTGHTTADVLHGSATLGAQSFERQRLLPTRPSARPGAALPPLHDLEPHVLVPALAHETLIADLAYAAMESLAAENAARMQAMAAARDNIERKLTELRRAEHRARQDQVTNELLDLVTGTRAIR